MVETIVSGSIVDDTRTEIDMSAIVVTSEIAHCHVTSQLH